MIVTLVPRDQLHVVWPIAGPLLDEALAYAPGRFTSADICINCAEGMYSLWVVADDDKTIIAVFTTRIYNVPSNRVCSIEWVGGTRLNEWIDEAISILENYAKDTGCGIIEGHGRTGWSKLLAKHGWHQSSVLFEKDLK